MIDDPVAIKSVELAIIDRAYDEGWLAPHPPATRTGRRVAIVGGGPAGLAAADQLNQMGHWVTVFERADRAGGLMQYGVPHPKIDKEQFVQRRINLLREEGVTILTDAVIGGAPWLMSTAEPVHGVTEFAKLERDFDAVLLSTGATVPRRLDVPGSQLAGIYPAMAFLHQSQKALSDAGVTGNNWRKELEKEHAGWIDVKDKRVIVIGSGDTGTDCLATAVRMGAKTAVLFDVVPKPSVQRPPSNPWPRYPRVFRVEYGHEEARAAFGKDPREWAVSVSDFIGEDRVRGVRTHRIVDGAAVPDAETVWEADVVLFAS